MLMHKKEIVIMWIIWVLIAFSTIHLLQLDSQQDIKATTGVCGACLHQVQKPCAIGPIPAQT